ncbi:MAG: hypothetical protein CMJ18_09660 [Phycisphaeraceae bacterium]|nr:hypothetical protein [Phycisphaeraceae bacterium]
MNDEVTKPDIVTGLAGLGIAPAAHIMVHASLSKFGHVDGGAATVVEALREAAGPGGAVVVPSFRDAIRSDSYTLRECREQCPQALCPSRERGYTGAVGETVRALDDAIRSCHPTHSWVGIGGGAEELLSGHRESPTPCGRESPFVRLMQQDGFLLLLGVNVRALTNVHVVEDARNVPYLSAIDPPHRHATYTTSGRRIQYRYDEQLQDALDRAGIVRTSRIGDATCHAIRARDFGSFLWVITEDDPWSLVLRPSEDAWDPDEDARRKIGRMVEVWTASPDRDAWQRLVAASQRQPAPNRFEPATDVRTDCPAYRGVVRDHHRCAANDIPPWESFSDYPVDEPGVATCGQCNWRGQ